MCQGETALEDDGQRDDEEQDTEVKERGKDPNDLKSAQEIVRSGYDQNTDSQPQKPRPGRSPDPVSFGAGGGM